jgi:type IV pilus assembly protein PilV
MTRIRYSHGLSLIEVLVALLVLSVGLLGLAGLQMSGLRIVNNASFYTQGTLAINDIIERMRANPDAVDNNDFVAVNSTAIDCTALPNPYCSEYHDGSNNVAAASCTADQLAAYDINVWFCGENIGGGGRAGGVAAAFPNAVATITCLDALTTDADACTNSSPHTVTLSWSELNPDRSGGADIVTKSITITVQP